MPINDNQKTIQRFIEINGEQIPVTEEVYRAYKRPLWAEHKRKEREKRCRDENGNRCIADCSKCDKQRIGSVLSLDRLIGDGFEPSDPSDLTELTAYNILLDQLYAALAELDPENSRIAELFSIGKTEREIAECIGRSQKTVNNRKPKIFAQLRERLKNWE